MFPEIEVYAAIYGIWALSPSPYLCEKSRFIFLFAVLWSYHPPYMLPKSRFMLLFTALGRHRTILEGCAGLCGGLCTTLLDTTLLRYIIVVWFLLRELLNHRRQAQCPGWTFEKDRSFCSGFVETPEASTMSRVDFSKI